MDIHKKNYEQYVLDYLDGSLPEHTEKEMERFFEQHPLLWQEVKDIDTFTVPKTEIAYTEKEALKKSEKKGVTPWTVGIAAALAGLLIWAGLSIFEPINKPTERTDVAIVEDETEQKKPSNGFEEPMQASNSKTQQNNEEQSEKIEMNDHQNKKDENRYNASKNIDKEPHFASIKTQTKKQEPITFADSEQRKQEQASEIKRASVNKQSVTKVSQLQSIHYPSITNVETVNVNTSISFSVEDNLELAQTPTRLKPFETALTEKTVQEVIANTNETDKAPLIDINKIDKETITSALVPKSFGFLTSNN